MVVRREADPPQPSPEFLKGLNLKKGLFDLRAPEPEPEPDIKGVVEFTDPETGRQVRVTMTVEYLD